MCRSPRAGSVGLVCVRGATLGRAPALLPSRVWRTVRIYSCLVLLRTDSGGEFDWGGTSVKR